LERLARVIHGVFPQRGHSTSLERVSTSFMGLFHNTSFDLDLACFCFIHGVRFSQNWFHSWGWFSQRSFNVVFASFRIVHGVCFRKSAFD
jgi:hypothetical protein